MLTGAMFMLEVYDRVLPSRSVPTLVGLVVLITFLFAALAVLDTIRGRILVRIGGALDEALSGRVYDTLVRLPLQVGRRSEGNQPLRDLDAIRSYLSGLGPVALFDLPWLPFYLAICFAFHLLIGLTALAGAIILIALTVMTEILLRAPNKAATEAAIARNSLAEASRRNAEALTAMGMVGRMAQRWGDANRQYMGHQGRASDVAGGLGAISKVLRMMLQSAVLAVGAYLVIHQEATAGIIIAGSILSARALAPVDLAIAHWKGFVAARQAWQRLTKLLAALPARVAPMALQPPTARLAVENASGSPPGIQKVVVQDIAFKLEAGQGLGIIGPSGSGKSSLARVLVGVWQPVRGSIRLDGAALDQWSPGRARPSYRLSAAGRRAARRHGGAEHRPLRARARQRSRHRRRQGGRRARHDRGVAVGLRHPDRRAGRGAFGRPGAARRAGARALRRSVPGRARRAQFQSRRRRRRGADARDSRRARAQAASSSSSRIGRAPSPASITSWSWPRAASRRSARRTKCWPRSCSRRGRAAAAAQGRARRREAGMIDKLRI